MRARALLALVALCGVLAGCGSDSGETSVEQGTGVSRNYQRARLLYEMAALRGHLTAQNNLGQLYMGSRGFAADYPKARLWLERAAERNHPSAVNALGMMYDHGQGVAVDRARARRAL